MHTRRSFLQVLSVMVPPAYLEELGEPEMVLLEGPTGHVQGLAVSGDSVWVTGVHREDKKGILLEFSRKGMKRRTVN